MILYIIGPDGYYQSTMSYPDDPDEINGIPYGTTKRAVPEELSENQYAVWNGAGWDLTNNPPAAVVEEEVIIIEGEVNNESVDIDPNV